MQVCFSLNKSRRVRSMSRSLKKKRKTRVRSGNKTCDLPYLPGGILWFHQVKHIQDYRFYFGWGIETFTPFLSDYDLRQYSLSTNCCTTTIIIHKNQETRLVFKCQTEVYHQTQYFSGNKRTTYCLNETNVPLKPTGLGINSKSLKARQTKEQRYRHSQLKVS